MIIYLEWGQETSVLQRVNSKYFCLWGPVSVTTTQLCPCSVQAVTDIHKLMGVAVAQRNFIYTKGQQAGLSL